MIKNLIQSIVYKTILLKEDNIPVFKIKRTDLFFRKMIKKIKRDDEDIDLEFNNAKYPDKYVFYDQSGRSLKKRVIWINKDALIQVDDISTFVSIDDSKGYVKQRCMPQISKDKILSFFTRFEPDKMSRYNNIIQSPSYDNLTIGEIVLIFEKGDVIDYDLSTVNIEIDDMEINYNSKSRCPIEKYLASIMRVRMELDYIGSKLSGTITYRQFVDIFKATDLDFNSLEKLTKEDRQLIHYILYAYHYRSILESMNIEIEYPIKISREQLPLIEMLSLN